MRGISVGQSLEKVRARTAIGSAGSQDRRGRPE
jgi:hypothetical protein